MPGLFGLMKMSLKQFIGKLHLWLGLITGLVVFIIALTGAIYCFAPELQNLTQPYRGVQEQNKKFLSPSKIRLIAEKQLAGKSAQRIYYGSRDQSVMVLFRNKDGFSHSVFVNPYNGEVLKVRNNRNDFFSIVLDIHRTLLIPYGHDVVRWSTLIFLIMLISGIILWWPKNKRVKKQGLVIKWKASPKRLNHDLHRVLGFYVAWIIIFTVFTGLIWTFEGFADIAYQLSGSKQSIIQKKPPVSDTTMVNKKSDAIDIVWQNIEPYMLQKMATALFVLPGSKKDPILLRANPEKKTLYKTDFRYFDQYSGKEIRGAYVWGKYEDAHTIADNLKRMNYDIHTGAILGFPGRIALFFAALIVASLPITGFYIWWSKKQGSKKLNKVVNKVVLQTV